MLQVRNNIEQNTGTAAGIALGGDGTNDTETAGIVGISDNSTGGVCQLALLYASGNISKEGMRIDSSGNVGIGITDPQDLLHVADGSIRVGTDSGDYGQFYYTGGCLLYTSPSPRDKRQSRMPSSA